jgi:lipoate-protein ligase A
MPASMRLLLDEQPARGSVNMAVDQALLESVQAGAPPALRFYQWSPACLSFGRNQTVRGIYDPERARRDGIDMVRRPTGGLAVLHHHELTYAIALPASLLGGPRSAYAAINRALVEGLARLGVSAFLAGDTHAGPQPGSLQPCFQQPAPGEVMATGGSLAGKLVGSAQRCERRTLLQHGSILLDGDQESVVAYRNDVPDQPAGMTLRAVLGAAPDRDTLTAAMVAGFEAVLGTRLAPASLLPGEAARARQLEVQYDSAAWTWRR